jgi:hypothetical protein
LIQNQKLRQNSRGFRERSMSDPVFGQRVPLPDNTQERTFGSMSSELMDAKIEAAEARTDTKFAHIEGQLALILEKLTTVSEDNRSTRTTVWGVGIGLAGLIIATIGLLTGFLAYSDDRFAAGMDASALANAAAQRAVQQAYPWTLQLPVPTDPQAPAAN